MTKPKPRDDDEIVSAATLARRLGLTVTSVSRLAQHGVLVKKSRAQYLIWASVRSYLAHRDKEAAMRASPASLARAELLKIQAERAALAFKREQAQLVDIGEMEDALRALVIVSRNAMLAVPSRIGSVLPSLSREDVAQIDTIVRKSLTGLATADPEELVAEQAKAEAARVKGRR